MQEENAYILGTDKEELFRLGLQHQIWASEAQTGWAKAGFTAGQTLLDLGCGPGFATRELAFIAGKSGKVIGVDLSKNYIEFLNQVSESHGLRIEGFHSDFNDMDLPAESLDGVYCRWSMAWIPNPKEILQKVAGNLKRGGKVVLHEYYDWSTHQTEPLMPHLSQAIGACLRSFKEQSGDIDVGRELPRILAEVGLEVTSIRPMAKMAKPNDITWQWPRSFYEIYFPKLVEMGFLTTDVVEKAMQDLVKLEQTPGASLCCPLLIEVIAEKK